MILASIVRAVVRESRLQVTGASCTRRWHEQHERDAWICMLEQERPDAD